MSDLLIDSWDFFKSESIPYKLKEQQQQSTQQNKQQAKPKQTIKKTIITQQKQQLSEQDLLNFVSNEIKAILTGQKSPQESKLFEDINKEQDKIKTDLQNTLQEYNNKMKELAEFTQKFNDAHSKMIGLFALMLGKSDLARHTNEHLFDKMRELVLYYPVDVVPLAMRSLITGYFAGKQASIDTDSMSVGELVTMGENPEFVAKLSPKSMEFLGQLIDAMPQIFQMKVAPYKIMLDKLQNESKILETRQTHQENILAKLQQLEITRLQRAIAFANILSMIQHRKEMERQGQERINIKKQELEEKKKESPTVFLKPENLKNLKEFNKP
jgi:hypothetical protein